MSDVHRGADFSDMSAPDDNPGLTFEQNFEMVREALGLDPDAPCHYEDQFSGTPPHTFGEAHLGADEYATQREVLTALDAILSEYNSMRDALTRCCEVIENDVRQLRREGFEGASWQLDAIRKARRFVETTDPLSDIGVTLEDR